MTTARRWTCCCTKASPARSTTSAPSNHRYNIEVAETILDLLDKPRSLIRFVDDRPGHDRRYGVNSDKIAPSAGRPATTSRAAIEKTVRWYAENRWWWEKVRAGEFHAYYDQQYGARLATATPYGDVATDRRTASSKQLGQARDHV